jgi:hypothetical protein
MEENIPMDGRTISKEDYPELYMAIESLAKKEEMKYPLEVYETTEFYGPDEDIEYHKQKVVRTRKMHKCGMCEKLIPVGTHALYESCFLDDGPHSCYTCIPCCDEWLDEIEWEEYQEIPYEEGDPE